MVSASTCYFAGDYTGCCDAATLESSSASVRSIWFRACLHLNRLSDARNLAKGSGALDAALLLYLEAFPMRNDENSNWSNILSKAEEAGSLEGDRDEVAIILSNIYAWAGQLEDVYRLASQSSTLEAQLLTVQYLATIGRFDLAEKRLEKLKKSHVDNIAFQIMEAELGLRRGGAHAKDSPYIYQELVQVYGNTPKLLNGLAAACLLLIASLTPKP
jgi:hypothetical protein